MFYIVGSWNRYTFVYDTADNSCEMITSKEFIKSTIDFREKCGSISYYKMCTMCNISDFKVYISIPIVRCTYSIGETCDTLEVGIRIVKSSMLLDNSRRLPERSYREWWYDTDAFVFLTVMSRIATAPVEFTDLLVYNDKFGSIVLRDTFLIPPVMLPYIISLRGSKNIDRLRSATHGICFENFFTLYLNMVGLQNIRVELTNVEWLDGRMVS